MGFNVEGLTACLRCSMAEAKRSLAAVIPAEALSARPCAIFRSRAASALACVECDCSSTCGPTPRD